LDKNNSPKCTGPS